MIATQITPYKGFQIVNIRRDRNFMIYKNNAPFSGLSLSTEEVAKKVIDVYYKNGGDKKVIFKATPKNRIENTSPKSDKIKTVRSVHLSEHEKMINKILNEN